mgnify:CR=1 FL=1
MKSKKIAAAFCLAAALTAMASPVLAARGGRGGGRVGGSPSITRTAPARPSQQTDRSAGRQSSQPIDQGIDPKDYGRRNAGKENTTAGTAGNTAGQAQNPAAGSADFSTAFRCGPGSGSADTTVQRPVTGKRAMSRNRRASAKCSAAGGTMSWNFSGHYFPFNSRIKEDV